MEGFEAEKAALAIFALMVVVASFGFVFDYQDAVKRKFRLETTDLVAERVAGDIQALSTFENRGQVEINLAAEKYNFDMRPFEQGGDYVYEVNISFEGKSSSYSNVSLNTEIEWEDGQGQYICLTKNSGIKAEVKEC